jgi:hypothetical protein
LHENGCGMMIERERTKKKISRTKKDDRKKDEKKRPNDNLDGFMREKKIDEK